MDRACGVEMRNASPALGIRLKLFLACITLTALSVAITQTIATRQIDGELIGRIRENLFVRLALVAHEASSAAIPPERGPRWDALADDLGGRAQGRVTLIGLDGSLLGDSELSLAELARVENHLNRPEVAAALTAGRGFSERRSPTLDRRMMYVAVPMKRGEQVLGVARLAMPLSDVDAVVGGVGRTVAWGAALALLFATALAGGAAQALSRRTRLLIGVARRMTEGGFDARADERGRDELATLAQALNGLAASHLRASTDLKDQRRIVERVLEAMREGVLVLDGDGRVTLVNAALREMLLIGGEIVGRTPADSLANPALTELLDSATKAQVVGELELSGLKPRRLLIDAGPMPGQPGGAVAVFIDMTAVRRLETAPRDFATSVSHELRAPLAAMAGAASSLHSDSMTDLATTRRLVDTVDRSVRRLQYVVADVLQLSRLEAEEFRLRPEPQDLQRLVAGLFVRFGPQAEHKRIRLVMDVSKTVGYVLADREALEHALSHLVDDALRSSPPEATISVQAGPDGPWANISVMGGGLEAPGARSFDPGMGLSLVRQLVQAMRGRLSVESQPGPSTVFTIALPRV